MVRAETDDAGAPHHGSFSGGGSHHFGKLFTVLLLLWIFERVDVFRGADVGRFRFVFRHDKLTSHSV